MMNSIAKLRFALLGYSVVLVACTVWGTITVESFVSARWRAPVRREPAAVTRARFDTTPRVAPEIRPAPYREWPLNTFIVPGQTEPAKCTSDFTTWTPCDAPKAVPLTQGQPFCVRGHVAVTLDGLLRLTTGLPYDGDQGAAFVTVPWDREMAVLAEAPGNSGSTVVVACGHYFASSVYGRTLMPVRWWAPLDQPEQTHTPTARLLPAAQRPTVSSAGQRAPRAHPEPSVDQRYRQNLLRDGLVPRIEGVRP